MSEKRQPWMKWYPADWRQEPTLRLCSRAARSLWCDMLGLMHEADPYGFLLVSGRPLTDRQIAAVLGDSEKDVRGWLAELEEAGVFSRNEDGVIYSRRMLRDKAKEEENRRNGKSGGNPRLGAKDKQDDKADHNQPDKRGVKGGDKAHIPEARSQIPDTEAKASGADAPRQAPPLPGFEAEPQPVDLKTELFGRCLQWLAKRSGRPPDTLRSLIGRWIKAAGEGAVLEAFARAEIENPVAPVDWLSAAIERRHGPTGKLASAMAGIASAGEAA